MNENFAEKSVLIITHHKSNNYRSVSSRHLVHAVLSICTLDSIRDIRIQQINFDYFIILWRATILKKMKCC